MDMFSLLFIIIPLLSQNLVHSSTVLLWSNSYVWENVDRFNSRLFCSFFLLKIEIYLKPLYHYHKYHHLMLFRIIFVQ